MTNSEIFWFVIGSIAGFVGTLLAFRWLAIGYDERGNNIFDKDRGDDGLTDYYDKRDY